MEPANANVNFPDLKDAVKDLISVADSVARMQFTWLTTGLHPYVDRYGEAVPIADAEDSKRATEDIARLKQERSPEPEVPLVKMRNPDLYVRPNRLATDLMAARIMDVTQALIARAVGCKAINKDGDVYDLPPDVKAIEVIMNRLMGRPDVYKVEEQRVDVNKNIHIFIPDNGRSDLELKIAQRIEEHKQLAHKVEGYVDVDHRPLNDELEQFDETDDS